MKPTNNTSSAEPDFTHPSPRSEPLRSILWCAINEGATDIHFDPIPKGKLVRFRVDGAIHEKLTVPREQCSRLLNQVKVAANLGIEKILAPEEAQILFQTDLGDHSIRVSTVPVANREAIHLHFEEASTRLIGLPEIGLGDEDLAIVQAALNTGRGMILVGGLTAAGKSTTLYALATALDVKSKITVSIEDPVELRLPGLRQIEVREKRGLTVAEGIRVALRMDPDAIAVGEIRDEESAAVAIRAALSGRLVTASVHAQNPAAMLDALQQLSVPPYVLGRAVSLLIVQDLVRKLCPACAGKVAILPDQAQLYESAQIEPPTHVYVSTGCEKCHHYGYRGRIGVFEVVRVDEQLRQAIALGALSSGEDDALGRACAQTLAADALQKASTGITSIDEALPMCLLRH